MQNLLENINLISVAFSEDGEDVLFKFADMYQLRECATANCRLVYVFDWHNSGTCLPVYIGEVNCLELAAETIAEKLKEVGFRFYIDKYPWAPGKGERKTYVPETDKAYFIHMEGGEISIYIVCADFEFRRTET